MGKVILLTGAPGTGKSTSRNALAARIAGLEHFDYGQLLLRRKQREGSEVSYEQLREHAVVWIPDSKTPNGIADVPLTAFAIEALKNQMAISGTGPYLFPSDLNSTGHLKKLKTVWTKTLRRAKVPYFRIYDLRSAYATRLSAGGGNAHSLPLEKSTFGR